MLQYQLNTDTIYIYYTNILYRDNFMSAEDALKYGLIDEIVQPNDEKLKSLSQPPPGQAPQLFGDLPKDAEDYQFGKLNVPKPRPGSGRSRRG